MYQLRGCTINLIVYRTVKYIVSVLGLFKTLHQISYINYDISSWKIDKVLILFHYIFLFSLKKILRKYSKKSDEYL